MLLSIAFSVLLSAVSLVTARPESYAVWAADSAISRGQGNGFTNGSPDVSYEHGEFWWALQLLYEATGNQTYYDYILESATVLVDDDGKIIDDYRVSEYNQDPVRTGPAFLYLYQQTGDERWKKAARTYLTQMHGQPRTAEGQFWHKQIYFNQGWLDGIYMGEIFYSKYTSLFDAANTTAWDDIEHQFQLMFKNTLQSEEDGEEHTYTGLLYHGYDYTKTAVWASDDRGHCPEIWDRALGWYMMALVDILEIVPESYAPTFLEQLQYLSEKLVAAADPDAGVWWLMMSQPGRAGNYFESSGSVMFTYALLKGVRLGFVDDADGSIIAAAKKAYQYIINNFVEDNGDGTMDWLKTVEVGSLSGNGTYQYYVGVPTRVNDLKGLAAFVLASTEYEKL